MSSGWGLRNKTAQGKDWTKYFENKRKREVMLIMA
jgi:hypothetical protein